MDSTVPTYLTFLTFFERVYYKVYLSSLIIKVFKMKWGHRESRDTLEENDVPQNVQNSGDKEKWAWDKERMA